MNRPEILQNLNDFEYRKFMQTYTNHNRSVETDKYSMDHIAKIKKNAKERCFEVYYMNGEWLHYTLNGTWY